jgi:hypothetical protein
MIRTILIPDDTKVQFLIPRNYVGRKIEVMCYPVDELVEENNDLAVGKMSSFRGILSSEETDRLQEYVRKSREEWKRDI